MLEQVNLNEDKQKQSGRHGSRRESDVGHFVLKRLKGFTKYSELEQLQYPRQLDWSEISGQRSLMGRGAFSDVYRVTLKRDGETLYALKRLNSVMPMNTKKFRVGAADLALEVKMLERLDHRNIIQLHGVKGGDLVESFNHRDYFLILDFLSITLDNQLHLWLKESTGILAKLNKRGSRKRFLHRLEHTGLGVARGMAYLHSKNIVFRDLKPENVGFDVHNVVKIFDFGLARDLSCVHRSGEMLGFTGTPRYMANEIGEGNDYGLKVDVYSFGILLWQICTLKDPFSDMFQIAQYHQWIVEEGRRPDIKLIKADDLQRLISQCWNSSPEIRPSFQQVCNLMQVLISDRSSHASRTALETSEHNDSGTYISESDAFHKSSCTLLSESDSAHNSAILEGRSSRRYSASGSIATRKKREFPI